ncbi:MAG: alpha/beta fold hydrolase [Acidimicrobiales bacterium]
MSIPTPWPAPAMIDLGRERLAVYDYGPPAGGASRGDVVFLHGMADVARSLEPLTAALTDRYRVLAFDARGHGRSTHPGAYSALHFVADLAALLDALHLEHPILIGHSLGGHTVANYAGLYPDRPRALVLLEGLGPPAVHVADTAAARLAHTRNMVEALKATPRHRPQADIAAAAARLTATHTRLDPQRALLLAEEGTIPGPDGGRVWRHDERTWHWIASVDHAALEERWTAITAPILAVSGTEAWDTWWARPGGPVADRVRLTDDQFAARLALFPDVAHVEVPDAGHMVHFDQPAVMNELIARFLRLRVEDEE